MFDGVCPLKMLIELLRYSKHGLGVLFKHSLWSYYRFFILESRQCLIPVVGKVPFSVYVHTVVVCTSSSYQAVAIELVLKEILGCKLVEGASK